MVFLTVYVNFGDGSNNTCIMGELLSNTLQCHQTWPAMGIYMRKSSNWMFFCSKPCLITWRYHGWDPGRIVTLDRLDIQIRVFNITTFRGYGDIYLSTDDHWFSSAIMFLCFCRGHSSDGFDPNWQAAKGGFVPSIAGIGGLQQK